MAVIHYIARVEENGRLALPEEAQEELKLQTGEWVEVSLIAPANGVQRHQTREKKKPTGMGAFAHVPGGSEEFAKEKQAEIDWEDRPRS